MDLRLTVSASRLSALGVQLFARRRIDWWLEKHGRKLHMPTMQTLKVDTNKRVVLSGTKHGQVFSRHDNPDGSIVLVPVKEGEQPDGEMFPAGSLLKYFTGALGRERDERDASLLSGCVQGQE